MTFDHLKLLLVALLLATGCRPPAPPDPGYLTVKGFALGTTWSVQFQAGGGEKEATNVLSTIVPTLNALESEMSTWQEDSTISKFNASTSTNWFAVSPDLVTVVAAARRVSESTGGAFDVTVFPLLQLWGFGPAPQPEVAPSTNQIEFLRASVGNGLLKTRQEPPALRKLEPKVQIDVSALAKGFAVDLVVELMRSMSYSNYLVEIGGELRGRGNSAKGRAWRVGLELPVVGESEIGSAVALPDRALATSGDYRNYLALNEKRYAHIVDPRTGFPIEQQGIAVSVLAPTCMAADAWATALTVLGLEQGLKVAEENNITVQFSLFKGDELVQRSSSRWPKNQ